MILIVAVTDVYVINLSGYVGICKFIVRRIFYFVLPVVITTVMCDSSNFMSVRVSSKSKYKTVLLKKYIVPYHRKLDAPVNQGVRILLSMHSVQFFHKNLTKT